MAYFELNDIKRDRVPYTSDFMWHLPWWSPELTNTPFMNMKKIYLGTIFSASIVEPVNHYWHSLKTLNLVYEWPRNTQQWSIFIREAFRIPHFWTSLRHKLVFGALQATMDFGSRLSSLQYFWGGTWSPASMADMNSPKYLAFSFLSSFAACWIGIPFYIARRAYYADQTWPAELRKGYRSPLHALLKIPFTEGPLFLFKGGVPFYIGNSIFTGWVFYLYTWLKNKLFFLWLYNDIHYNIVKFCTLNISFAIGAMLGYPFICISNLMENWPKERGGKCTFEGSTWNAVKWVRLNWESYNVNLYHGFWSWFRKYGIIFYMSCWFGDNVGIFTNNMSDPNTILNIVGEEESD